MGFFSWTCAKTNLPIMAGEAWGDFEDLTEVVLLTERGNFSVRGTYDGYGNIEATNLIDTGLSDLLDSGRAKMVLAKFYDPKVDTYDNLGKSQFEPGQGYFHNEEFVLKCIEAGGFASYEGYCLAYRDAVPFDLAVKLTASEAKVLSDACGNLSKAVLEERVNRMRGAYEVPVAPESYAAPSMIAIVPVAGDPTQFAVHVGPDHQGGERGRELARLTLTADGEGSFAETARALVDACAPQRLGKFVFVRDFETVAEITSYKTETLEHWYEVEADGRKYAFWGCHDALDHFKLEKPGEVLNALVSFDESEEVLTFEQPSLLPDASPTLH